MTRPVQIARDVLQALGKRFRDRAPRDPRRLLALAVIWLRAECARELVIAGSDRRPAADWSLLRDLASEAGARLTLVIERGASSDHLDELGDDVRKLTLSELVEELPLAAPPDKWGVFDESGSPDDRPGYPAVPDVDFAFFPSACISLLAEHDAARVLGAFERARAATMLWLELRRGMEHRHGQSPRHAHAFLDTLVAPCVTIDGAITVLRGAQAAFLLDGTPLKIDPDAFAADHQSNAPPYVVAEHSIHRKSGRVSSHSTSTLARARTKARIARVSAHSSSGARRECCYPPCRRRRRAGSVGPAA